MTTSDNTTTLPKKFAQIDSLRCIAVFIVLSAHWGMANRYHIDIIGGGSRGVDLFFVISGFLITLGLLRSRDDAQPVTTSIYHFYARRFLRIFPIYYLTILVIWGTLPEKVSNGIGWYLTYTSNFYNIRIQDWGGIGHLWSLGVEEQFYLVWPFVILLSSKRALPWIIGSCILFSIACKVLWMIQGRTFWIFYVHPFGALDTLAMGALLAGMYYSHDSLLKSVVHNIYWSIGFVLVLIFCIYCHLTPYSDTYDIRIRTCFGIFCVWLVARSVYGIEGIVGWFMNLKAIQYVGKISYSMYLFHPFIPLLFNHWKLPNHIDIQFLIYFIATVMMSTISWYLFEQPILSLKDRFR